MGSYTKLKIIIFLSILILIFLILKLKDLLTPKEKQFLKAAEDGDFKKIKSIIDKEVNIKSLIETKDKENNTALILASKFGYIEVVKILIANINAKNNDNSTALIEASSFYYETVKILADINAIENGKDNVGTTALMNASTEDDYIEICKLLIENGANVNDKDLQGANALIYASTFEN